MYIYHNLSLRKQISIIKELLTVTIVHFKHNANSRLQWCTQKFAEAWANKSIIK